MSRYLLLLLGVVLSFVMFGCGSGSGSTSYLTTVTTAPVGTTADATSTVLASGNTSDAAVAITIQSTAYANIAKPSPVTVKSTTIRYVKTGNSPASAPATLPDQSGPTGIIAPGGTQAFSFVPASGVFKDNLVTNSGFIPGGPKWEYRITYYFDAVEDFVNRSYSFSVDGGKITFQ